MSLKNLFKVILLVSALIFVLILKEGTFSPKFKDQVAQFFGVYSQKYVSWCADHVIDFTIVNQSVSDNFKNIPMVELRDKYCSLPVENINHIDLDSVKWEPLFESAGATGIKTQLQWNVDLELFRFKGLPFKSSSLAYKLKH